MRKRERERKRWVSKDRIRVTDLLRRRFDVSLSMYQRRRETNRLFFFSASILSGSQREAVVASYTLVSPSDESQMKVAERDIKE